MPLAFPLVNMTGGATDCEAFMADAEGGAKLDGVAVEVDRYGLTAVAVTASAGKPLTSEGGTFLTGACGLWVQLPPLRPGDHSVRLWGRSGGFEVSVDYVLTVEATGEG